MTDFTLERLAHDDLSTHSGILAPNGLTPLCHAIERAKAGGEHPRIPSGRYKLVRRAVGASRFDYVKHFPRKFAPWYRGMIEVSGVPGRIAILIHPANWAHELLGCIAPCLSVTHDMSEGWTGSNSTDAFVSLYKDHLYPAIDAGETFLIVRDID